MQIVLNLQGHRLLAGIRQTLSSGSKEVDEIKLEVDETWKGFGKIAVFCVGKKCQYTVVDEVTQTAKIPAEVLRNEAVITIGIVGFKNEAVMTSTLVVYQIEKGSVVTIEDPEPSIYAEILSRYADLATRFNNIIANAGDLTNNAELIDARVGADDVVYDTLGEAVRGQVGSLSEEIDILNQGGLNLKEDFIGKQVDEWLDLHPESTTTVQDGSIEEIKFTESLKMKTIKDYITPEMFGAKGDGSSDDTTSIKNAILYAKQNSIKELRFLSKTYAISNGFLIDFPLVVSGISPKISVIKTLETFQSDNVFEFTVLKTGGGVQKLQIIGNKQENGLVLSGELEPTVNSGFIVSDVVLNNFRNGLKYLKGWQTTIRDIYVSGCTENGMYVTAADNTLHDINISGCTCGLLVAAGTNKIVNVKIDNCITSKNGYACEIKNERGSVYGLEVQFCAPNGIKFSGNYMTCDGIVIDQIGLLVDQTVDDTGNAIAFGISEHSTYNIKYRHYGNTNMLAYDNGGTVNNNISNIYEVTKKSDISIYTDVRSIFTKYKSESYELPLSISELITLGILTKPIEGTQNEYESNFKIEINSQNIPDLGSYKAVYFDIRLKSDGSIEKSLYKSENSVVEKEIKMKNGIYAILKDGTEDFTIHFSSTERIKLYSVKVILYKELSKINF